MKVLVSFEEAAEMVAYARELERRLPAPGLEVVVLGWMVVGDCGVWIEIHDDGGVWRNLLN